MYNDDEKNMNLRKRTGHQISIRGMDTDRYRRKDVTERNSNRINKN